MIRIDNLKIFKDLSEEEIIKKALKINNINKKDIIDAKIIKKSIDARNKKKVHYNYSLNIKVIDENKYSNLKIIKEKKEKPIVHRRKSNYKPIIIGSGPAGLFCALTLIEEGYKPIIIEQGMNVDDRVKIIDEYKYNSKINRKSNVQFGEGGAGTFSDGKLTTNTKSIFIQKILKTFYKFGAPKEILYLNKPHIGTDNLINIMRNMREYIENNGGKYYFNTKFIDFEKNNDEIEIKCDNGLKFKTDALVLAIGHSARDTLRMLKDKNLEMKQKNFAIGLRVEHKQKMINHSQYGKETQLKLPPAEYKLVYHDKDRICYSFCMCPGGEVIASASEENTIVTNGMSTFKRDKENANSALLVNVLKSDLKSSDPLEAIKFQEELEKKAFELGGSNYNAPVQRIGDFLNNKKSTEIGNVIPSYKPGYTLSNLNEILPDFVSETLKKGILDFDKKIKGFADPDGILTGIESRSTSPVTILRNDSLMSNINGIYPCGEGAGYAGGITSAAIDGIKVAIKIIEKDN